MKVKLLLFGLMYLSSIFCQVTIIGPPDLVSIMKNFQLSEKTGLEYEIGNFGDVPFGKSQIGYIFYHPNTDNKNSWCEFGRTSTPAGINNFSDAEYSPIFLVDYSDDCSFTRQALNVQQRGGKLMLLVSNDDSFKDHKNVDDKIGDKVDIPTIIIKKDEGEEIKKYIKGKPTSKPVISIKFLGKKYDGALVFDLFLRSDDPKSLHFFNEFRQYYIRLKNKWVFTPYYKYTRSSWENSSDRPTATKLSSPCFMDGKYCASDNPSLQIDNAREVLMENIRQSCIYQKYWAQYPDAYWDYMARFSDTCMDINNPIFTEECAKQIRSHVGIDEDTINECVKEVMRDSNSVVSRDYQAFIDRKVHVTPEIQINGIKYRGNWHASHIFEEMCDGFMDDPICSTPSPSDIISDSGVGIGTIILIALLIFLTMIVIVICYRRIVNLSLEATLNEKIQSQAIHSISQYEVFQDENTGRKTVDISKI